MTSAWVAPRPLDGVARFIQTVIDVFQAMVIELPTHRRLRGIPTPQFVGSGSSYVPGCEMPGQIVRWAAGVKARRGRDVLNQEGIGSAGRRCQSLSANRWS